MRMSEKCCNNNNKHHKNSDNPLTARRTDGSKNSMIDEFQILTSTTAAKYFNVK